MDDYSMFRQAIRGFDRDDVIAYLKKQEEEHGRQIVSMERDIRKRDKVISELKSRIVLKDEQVERMEREIQNKYQKYIDNYEQIGELIYMSKVQGEQIVAEARAEADRILAEAEAEAKQKIGSVQGQIDAKLKDGKEKYLEVQDEMNEIVDMFNQMQKKFMLSYKEIHEIIQNMPDSLDEIDVEDEDEPEEGDTVLNFDHEILLDEDDFDDLDLDSLLDFDLEEELRAIDEKDDEQGAPGNNSGEESALEDSELPGEIN